LFTGPPPPPPPLLNLLSLQNAPGNDRDVVILTTPGKNLLHLGDENGITIPRACRTGLCGTCTASLEDPSWTGEGEEGGSEGIQTIRCCSAQAMVPDGCDEMVSRRMRASVPASRKAREGKR